MKTLLFSVLALTAPVLAAADTNVALNANVSLSGSFGGDQGGWGNLPLAVPGVITNGAPQADGTQWNSGTIFWNDLSSTITIDLGALYAINSVVVQADNNDQYQVSYLSGANWLVAGIADYDYNGGGLATRTVALSSSPIVTNELQIQALAGDNYYSVGQIVANGVAAVPAPGAFWLFGTALAGFVGLNRKRS